MGMIQTLIDMDWPVVRDKHKIIKSQWNTKLNWCHDKMNLFNPCDLENHRKQSRKIHKDGAPVLTLRRGKRLVVQLMHKVLPQV